MKSDLFGDWLKRARQARGMTQGELEDQASLGYAYVSKVERGRTKLPSEDVRGRIHEVLGTSDDDLVQAGILERIDTPGYDPVYVPAASPLIPPAQDPQALRAVAETEERYDAIDARYRLRLRADTLTEPQAEAILFLIDAFTGHDR